MKIFVSIFGRNNYAWPTCLNDSVIVTMTDERLLPFWEAKDRDGFVNFSIAHLKTERGNIPNRQTASRWYGLIDNVVDTANDYWIHREDEHLWWTTSKPDLFEMRIESPPAASLRERVGMFRKPCVPWTNKNLTGKPLTWAGLHPKARNMLSTQSTQITIGDDGVEYVLALLKGESLAFWHDSKVWRDAADKARSNPVRSFNARQRAIWRMVAGVKSTVAQANGQMVERFQKNKELRLSDDELSALIDEMLDDQDSCCNISGIPLQLDGEETDKQLLCSLDRIDSAGHYERGNLQLLCRFINKWKSADHDVEMRRLLNLVRASKQ